MKCIIVDDEAAARRSLARLCDQIEDLTIVATCKTGQEALSCLKKESIDLMLVASRMPQIPQSDLGQDSPQVILVTDGNDQSHLMGHNAIDFISKPLSLTRLSKAVERVRLRKRMLKPSENPQEVYVRIEGRLIRIKFGEILYIEAVGSRTLELHTLFQSHTLADTNIYEFASKLRDDWFFKVSRNFVVNLKKVLSIRETSLIVGSKEISISRAIRPMLVRQIESLH